MNPWDEIAPYYDLEHAGLTSDTTMYAEFVRERGGQVLVLGVGTGRVAAALAGPGCEVWGVDSSPAMLAIAASKFREDVPVHLIEGDVTTVELARWFPLVIVPFDTFTMLRSTDEQLRALERCRTHLREGGLLVIDVINPFSLPSPEQNGLRRRRFEAMSGGTTVVAYESFAIDGAAQVMLLRLEYQEFNQAGRRDTRVALPVRWVYRFELAALMKLAGLQVTAVYGDYDRSQYNDASPRMIVTAAKSEH